MAGKTPSRRTRRTATKPIEVQLPAHLGAFNLPLPPGVRAEDVTIGRDEVRIKLPANVAIENVSTRDGYLIVDAAMQDVEPRQVLTLADSVHKYVSSVVTFKDVSDADLVTVWVLGAYVFDAFGAFPYLRVMSDGPEVGKTKLGRVIQSLTGGIMPGAMSLSALIRAMRTEDGRPRVMVLDEFDNLLGSKSTDIGRLYGILNAGFNSDGIEIISDADNGRLEPQSIIMRKVSGPKVLLGIIDPGTKDTLVSRCIPITLLTQTVEEYRSRKPVPVGEYATAQLRNALSSTMPVLHERIRSLVRHDHTLPNRIPVFNRNGDLWEPLFAIAEYLGNGWVERLYHVAQRHVTGEPIEVATGEQNLDAALREALREGFIRPRNYADPKLAPDFSGLGLGSDDFGYNDRRGAWRDLSLVIDRDNQRAELRWRSKDTDVLVGILNKVARKEYTARYVRETWNNAGRLRTDSGRRSLKERLYRTNADQETLMVLKIDDWPWNWPGDSKALPSAEQSTQPLLDVANVDWTGSRNWKPTAEALTRLGVGTSTDTTDSTTEQPSADNEEEMP